MELLKKGDGNFDYYLSDKFENVVISKPKPNKSGCKQTIFGKLKYYKKLEEKGVI